MEDNAPDTYPDYVQMANAPLTEEQALAVARLVAQRHVGVVTTSRADYGIIRPLLKAIASEPSLSLEIYISGSHLSPEFGMTVEEIRADGFEDDLRIEGLLSSDSDVGVAKSMALTMLGFAEKLSAMRPDILVCLGDRFEMFAAACAAVPLGIPIAHIHGGEVTEGSRDEYYRHALTKLASLHFASTFQYGERIFQMGEEPWRIYTPGALSLDAIKAARILDLRCLGSLYVDPRVLERGYMLALFHPTGRREDFQEFLNGVWGAGEMLKIGIVILSCGADAESRSMNERLRKYCSHGLYKERQFIGSVKPEVFYGLMKNAICMVGNSSAGIVEAGFMNTHVINVGDRQKGRVRGPHIMDVPCIDRAIMKGIDETSKRTWNPVEHPYGDGHAAEKILEVLKTVDLEKLQGKKFIDV